MVLNGALLSRHTDINCRAWETNGREASHRYMVHTETVWSLKNKKIRKKYTHTLITHLALAQTLVCNYGAHNIRKMSTSNDPISPMDAVYLCMRPYDKKNGCSAAVPHHSSKVYERSTTLPPYCQIYESSEGILWYSLRVQYDPVFHSKHMLRMHCGLATSQSDTDSRTTL